MKSQIKMRCGKVRTILQYHGKIKVCIQKNMQIICFFCFSISRENDLVDYGAKNELEDFRFNAY